MIKTKTPGKLFIAGEYGVTEPGYPAILVAVDRFIKIEVEESLDRGTIRPSKERSCFWTRKEGKIILNNCERDFKYMLAAMEVVEKYAEERGKELSFYHIRVESQLEGADGSKYGLGSSAAITVGLVEALTKYYDLEAREEEIFKLGALANLKINPKGSCGDIAASSYGGWISFTSFDNSRVLDLAASRDLAEVLNHDWPGLEIKRLNPPKNLKLLVGWTGSPASTVGLVQQVKAAKDNGQEAYQDFLTASRATVEEIIRAFEDNNIKIIKEEINKNGDLLEGLGKNFQVDIVTDKLKTLIQLGREFGGGSKSSGAGGGDCGFTLLEAGEDWEELIEKWKKAGIRKLDLRVAHKE